jgi:Zn-dependent protease
MNQISANDLTEEFDFVGNVFDAPLVTKGKTWLPITQVILWLIMVKEAGRLHPNRSTLQRIGIAVVTMPTILGSEWLHNLAHTYAAKMVGHPVDAIRVSWGMPLLIYHDIEDQNVSPRNHVIRSSGGPILNLILWGSGSIMRRFSSEGSAGRDIADALIGTNAFLFLAGMIPQPWLDGGAILKWALVDKGDTLEGADEKVRAANYTAAAIMGITSAAAWKKKKKLISGTLAALTGLSLLTAIGILKEK